MASLRNYGISPLSSVMQVAGRSGRSAPRIDDPLAPNGMEIVLATEVPACFDRHARPMLLTDFRAGELARARPVVTRGQFRLLIRL